MPKKRVFTFAMSVEQDNKWNAVMTSREESSLAKPQITK